MHIQICMYACVNNIIKLIGNWALQPVSWTLTHVYLMPICTSFRTFCIWLNIVNKEIKVNSADTRLTGQNHYFGLSKEISKRSKKCSFYDFTTSDILT